MKSKLLVISATVGLLVPALLMGQAPERATAARNRQVTRPQASTSRIAGQANSRATSPSPGQSRVAERNRPEPRRGNDQAASARSERGNQVLEQAEPRREGPSDLQGRPGDPRLRGSESPRQAMERGLRNRLSQIDRMRDLAIETGNLDLLNQADRLELDARRKFSSLTQRIDLREQAGQPGVGPLVQSPRPNDNPRGASRVARVPDVSQELAPETVASPTTSDSDLP
ncbi:MAG TPA: hypothetical protein VMM76_16625 [Pirellulaceae bacterium]|nr:hypothetical protein [Pirellulaceae bacterium]